MKKVYRCWIIQWQWFGNHAKKEPQIISIQNSRKSKKQIQEFVKQAYADYVLSPLEQIDFMKNRHNFPFQVKIRIIKNNFKIWVDGPNPWIEAYRGKILITEINGKEQLKSE